MDLAVGFVDGITHDAKSVFSCPRLLHLGFALQDQPNRGAEGLAGVQKGL